MRFFEDQERARKETRKLYFCFLAVSFFTALSTALSIDFYLFFEDRNRFRNYSYLDNIFEPDRFLFLLSITGIVILFIMGASFFKSLSISGNGAKIAAMIGGIPVGLDTEDLEMRTYLNVVQEMAIASGIPIPRIYYMPEEPSINAFAAGNDISNAAVCVTEGALKKLTRDELQGVIAHEFGHIFNGDMKINTKLVSVTFGLGCIYEIGLRVLNTRSRRYSRRSRDGDGGALLGVAFVVIGYFGMLMAHWIKSLISQQREFLADAASVQYTRNPDGIGNTLKKIWVTSFPFVTTTTVNEINHFFLSNAHCNKYINFKTHPSIEERLKRVYPNIDIKKAYEDALEEFIEIDGKMPTTLPKAKNKIMGPMSKYVSSASAGAFEMGETPKYVPSVPIEKEVLEQAAQFFSLLPPALSKGVKDPVDSCNIILAILGHQEPDRANFEKFIEAEFGLGRSKKVIHYYDEIDRLKTRMVVPLLDLTLGSLKYLKLEEKKELLSEMKKIIMLDDKVNINELIIYLFIYKNLLPRRKRKLVISRSRLIDNASILFSLLAQEGQKDDEAIQAFKSVSSFFGNSPNFVFVRGENIKFKKVYEALCYLELAEPNFLEMLSNALYALAKYDNKLEVKEYEIIRVYCQCLGIPTPFKTR